MKNKSKNIYILTKRCPLKTKKKRIINKWIKKNASICYKNCYPVKIDCPSFSDESTAEITCVFKF